MSGPPPMLSEREVKRWLGEHPHWRLEGDALVRELTMRDFDAALRLVEQVAQATVDYGRRPDMCLSEFNRVRLSIANLHHAGFTAAELRLANKAGAIVDEHHPDAILQP